MLTTRWLGRKKSPYDIIKTTVIQVPLFLRVLGSELSYIAFVSYAKFGRVEKSADAFILQH